VSNCLYLLASAGAQEKLQLGNYEEKSQVVYVSHLRVVTA